MTPRRQFKHLLPALCAGLGTCVALAAEPAATLTLQEPWSNVFGGKEAVFHAVITGVEPQGGRVSWRLAADGRTLARGEGASRLGEVVEIRIRVPDVKPGVIMQTALEVGASVAGSDKEIAALTRPLWIFPDNPFAGRAEWLKKLDIHLFDPVGATAKLFTEVGIPFARIDSVDALRAGGAGMIVVGEGISFREYRGLAATLFSAAADGRRILCLAPEAGELQLPVSGDPSMPQPESLALRRKDIIKHLDKRLDAAGWTGAGKRPEGGLKLRGDRGPVMAEVGNDAGVWPWMEVGYGVEHGKLVVCGFGIIGAWADSPTPRFLLLKVLEQVSGNKIKE